MAEEMLLNARKLNHPGGFVDSGYRPNAVASDVLKSSNINSLDASLELKSSLGFSNTT
jgi:hypothetical protein